MENWRKTIRKKKTMLAHFSDLSWTLLILSLTLHIASHLSLNELLARLVQARSSLPAVCGHLWAPYCYSPFYLNPCDKFTGCGHFPVPGETALRQPRPALTTRAALREKQDSRTATPIERKREIINWTSVVRGIREKKENRKEK